MISIQKARRSVETLLLLAYVLLPFWKIGGESAFRFDVPTLKLHFFGTSIWLAEFYYVMLATLSFAFLFIFLTLVFGRVWCGWFCSQTVFCDLTGFFDKNNKSILAHALVLLFSAMVGIATVFYFVSPYEAIPLALSGELGKVASISMIVLTVILYLDLAFLRRIFCATICPYAKMQGAITDKKTLVITLDEDRKNECINCKQCLKSCPTGVDIREGMQVSCIMCAACIDSCKKVMSVQNKKGLIGYRFGSGPSLKIRQLFRPAAVIVGVIACSFFAILLYNSGERLPFDFNVLAHRMQPKVTDDGEVINSYILSIKNMSSTEIALTIALDENAEKMELRSSINDELLVPAGVVEKFPLFIATKNLNSGDSKFVITLTNENNNEQSITKSAYFIIP